MLRFRLTSRAYLFAGERLGNSPISIGVSPVGSRRLGVMISTRVTDGNGGILFGRKADIEEHIKGLRSEFLGNSELALLHAATIARIRRQLSTQHDLAVFFAMWESFHRHLTSELTSRWLVAALDTLSDYGRAGERQIATAGSILINTVKLADTERRLEKPPRSMRHSDLSPTKPPVMLWDGISTFNIRDGDMVRNLIDRLYSNSEAYPIVATVLRTLIARLQEGPNLITRLNEHHRKLMH